MKNSIMLGILFVAIIAVGTATLTAVLDPTMAFADKPRDNPGDDDRGTGNDPPRGAPGQTGNPHPGR